MKTMIKGKRGFLTFRKHNISTMMIKLRVVTKWFPSMLSSTKVSYEGRDF